MQDPYYAKLLYLQKLSLKSLLRQYDSNFYIQRYPKKHFKLESLFERIKYLVDKTLIRTVVIDTYFTVEDLVHNQD